MAATAVCWALAVVLYRVGSEGSMARKLAVLLVMEGLPLITAGFPESVLGVGLDFYAQHPMLDVASTLTHHLADAGMVALYPPFLAAALATGLTRPFGRSPGSQERGPPYSPARSASCAPTCSAST